MCKKNRRAVGKGAGVVFNAEARRGRDAESFGERCGAAAATKRGPPGRRRRPIKTLRPLRLCASALRIPRGKGRGWFSTQRRGEAETLSVFGEMCGAAAATKRGPPGKRRRPIKTLRLCASALRIPRGKGRGCGRDEARPSRKNERGHADAWPLFVREGDPYSAAFSTMTALKNLFAVEKFFPAVVSPSKSSVSV